MATQDRVHHPVTSVLTAVVSEVAYLLQTELRLARAELAEKFNQYINGSVLLGAAIAVALPGLVVFLLGIARWLAVAGMAEQWALLLVGVVVIAIGAGLAFAGIKALKVSPVPERTIEQVRADFSIAKEQVQ